MAIDHDDLKQKVLDAAKKFAKRGPGYAQQRPVFNEVLGEARRTNKGETDLDFQQAILTCWHDLFREGKLSWGYNLDNPDSPFFHIPEREPQTTSR